MQLTLRSIMRKIINNITQLKINESLTSQTFVANGFNTGMKLTLSINLRSITKYLTHYQDL